MWGGVALDCWQHESSSRQNPGSAAASSARWLVQYTHSPPSQKCCQASILRSPQLRILRSQWQCLRIGSVNTSTDQRDCGSADNQANMLSLIRQARSGSTVAGAILRLASDSLVAAEGAAALPSLQHSASRASVTQLLTNLRLFDPRPPAHAGFFSLSPVAAGHQPPPQAHASGQHCGSRTSGLSSSLHSSSSSSSTGSAAGCSPASTHRGLATSAARLQDGAPAGGAATPAATPPEGVNPLQALPGVGGGNPLSGAVPAAGGPARDPIARAILRNTKISPQKLNDFARIVRRLHVDEAIVQCQISIKKAAKLVQNVRILFRHTILILMSIVCGTAAAEVGRRGSTQPSSLFQ